mgnify:CR=1 FL=1
MSTVETEISGGVGIVRLSSGRKNPINPDLVKDLSERIEEIKEGEEIQSLVLTSSDDRFFSIGLDVPRLIDLERSEFRKFIREFNLLCLDIYTLPKPSVASINGHAIAGGCILALCCDYRYMSEGKRLIGLNEVKLGVSVPYLPHKILEQTAGERTATEMIYGGEFYSPEKALEMGVVDEIFSSEELLEKSVEKARNLGRMPGKAFAAVKENRTESIKEKALERLEKDVDVFVELWFSEEGQKRLREAAKNF